MLLMRSNLSYLIILLLIQLSIPSEEFLIIPGHEQIYQLNCKVSTKEVDSQSKKETSYTLIASLFVSSIWNSESSQLLKVKIENPRISASLNSVEGLKPLQIQLSDKPFYIGLFERKFLNLLGHKEDDDPFLKNLERAVASLFVFEPEEEYINEIDISGECQSHYKSSSAFVIYKIKRDCSHWEARVNSQSSNFPSFLQNSQATITYRLASDESLVFAQSKEFHLFSLAINPNIGISLYSKISFLLESSIIKEKVEQLSYKTFDEVLESLMNDYDIVEIEAQPDVESMTDKFKPPENFEPNLDIKKLEGKSELALFSAELIPLWRNLTEIDFFEILKTNKNIHGHLMDVLGATQTFEAYKAANDFFSNSKKTETIMVQRYLQSLAVGHRAEKNILISLFGELRLMEKTEKSMEMYATTLHTLASLINRSQMDSKEIMVKEFVEFVEKNLKECKEDDWKTLFIRAFQNLQDLDTIPSLIEMSLSENTKICIAALQALQAFDPFSFYPEEINMLTSIFYEIHHRYDSTARLIALEILLASKPSYEDLGYLLDFLILKNQQKEITRYLLQNLNTMASGDIEFRNMLKKALLERPDINNYDNLSSKGRSLVLQREISKTPFFNESYYFTQEIFQGFPKRSNIELVSTAGNFKRILSKITLSISGFGAYLQGNKEETNKPASISLDIALEEVAFQPKVMVTSMTKLLGHIWKGSFSQPTSVSQSTLLEHDFDQSFVLSSGITVYLNLIGTNSQNLKGKINVSLWKKKADGESLQSTGTAIVGNMIAGSSFARVQNSFTVTKDFQASFKLNSDFLENVRICSRLEISDIVLNVSYTRSVTLTSPPKSLSKRVLKRRIFKAPAKTIAVDQQNNNACKKMLK